MPVHHVANWPAVDQKIAELERKGETVVQVVESPRGVTIITTKAAKFETRSKR